MHLSPREKPEFNFKLLSQFKWRFCHSSSDVFVTVQAKFLSQFSDVFVTVQERFLSQFKLLSQFKWRFRHSLSEVFVKWRQMTISSQFKLLSYVSCVQVCVGMGVYACVPAYLVVYVCVGVFWRQGIYNWHYGNYVQCCTDAVPRPVSVIKSMDWLHADCILIALASWSIWILMAVVVMDITLRASVFVCWDVCGQCI